MNLNKRMILICLAYVCLVSCGTAQNQNIKLPTQDTQRLSVENLNFSGSNFIEAYMSIDVNQRRLAEMYLIGVLDSTEGKAWCDYSVALPGSIQEQIYIGFKKESKTSLNRRASEIITSILSKKLPCRKTK